MTLDLEKFFSLSFEMFCIAGTDGFFKKINPAFSKILGYPENELLGKPFVDFVHPDDQSATLEQVARLSGGSSTTHFINRYRTKKGDWKWFDWIAVPSGSFIYATARDITTQKATELALRKAERLASIGTLAAGIAHELNNPIGLLQLQLDNVLANGGHSKNTLNTFRQMQKNIDRAAHIVKSVLRFSRKESSEKSQLHFENILKSALDLSSQMLCAKAVDIQVEQIGTLEPIFGNAIELEQVLINLIHNATFASKFGGTIHVTMRQTEPGLRFTIEDHGLGMSEEEVDRAFDPFFTTRTETGGTGLGLSTCYGIMSDHGGRIEIESALEKGTVVSLFIPSAVADQTFSSENVGK